MKKEILISAIAMLFSVAVMAQATSLPVKEWQSKEETPFVLYVTGDGGFNDFSVNLSTAINNAGYSITAINAKSYFWDKKTPDQTVSDITEYLTKIFAQRKNQQLVLAGYSFGADVMPFIVNRLSEAIKKKLISVVLLSPSTSTDFEIHMSDILGGNKKRDMDVVMEINKMQVPKGVIIFGNDEDSYPAGEIKLKTMSTENLQGGHHFDGNAADVAKAVLKYF